MTTITCPVCGAAEDPGQDPTCPVCGADLPAGEDGLRTEQASAEPPSAPTFDAPTSDVPPADADAPTSDAPTSDVPPADAPTSDADAPAPPAGATPPPAAAWPAAGAVPPPPPSGAAPGSTRPSPHDPSHPSGLSSSLRTYGMLTHLSAFAGALVALAFVGPLVMWLVRRDEHPFIDHHGKEALNFNLSMLLYLVIGIVASVATLGIGLVVVVPAAGVFFLTWVIATIVAAVKANAGEGFRYPLCIRFIGDDV